MRLTVILGLDHEADAPKQAEAARILRELAETLAKGNDLQPGDMHILRDMNGNRVGVADVFAN